MKWGLILIICSLEAGQCMDPYEYPKNFKDSYDCVQYGAGGVTQMPHPFFQTPFYQLHPCHTEKWMKEIFANATAEKKYTNYLVTWLSFIAPHVGLNISEKYAL